MSKASSAPPQAIHGPDECDSQSFQGPLVLPAVRRIVVLCQELCGLNRIYAISTEYDRIITMKEEAMVAPGGCGPTQGRALGL